MKSVKSQFQPEGRLQSIDALRGVAALGVVLYHAVMQTTNAVPDNLFRWSVKLIQYLSFIRLHRRLSFLCYLRILYPPAVGEGSR